MKFKFLLVLLLLLPQTGSGHGYEDISNISVCLLIDKDRPVNLQKISLDIDQVFYEYKVRVGIKFKIIHILTYGGDLDWWGIDQGLYLRGASHQECDINLVLSNKIKFDDETGVGNQPTGKEVAGHSSPEFGFIIMFNVETRYQLKDAAGNSSLQTSLKHELGHLFGLNHSENKRSFMYRASNKSCGEWIPDVTERIKKNKYRQWLHKQGYKFPDWLM